MTRVEGTSREDALLSALQNANKKSRIRFSPFLAQVARVVPIDESLINL